MNLKVVPAGPASKTSSLLCNKLASNSVSFALANASILKSVLHRACMISTRLLMLFEPASVTSPLRIFEENCNL